MRFVVESLGVLLLLAAPSTTVAYSWQSACFAGSPTTRQSRGSRRAASRGGGRRGLLTTSSLSLARGAPTPTPATGTYVEGSEYDNPLDEIEAMGGDPFFLEDDDSSSGGANLQVEPGEGEDTTSEDKWEWDGVVDEEAHIDIE